MTNRKKNNYKTTQKVKKKHRRSIAKDEVKITKAQRNKKESKQLKSNTTSKKTPPFIP